MPRNETQKAKLLALREIFLEHTDEDHHLTMPEIIQHLEHHGIRAERKSLYTDFEVLGDFGAEVLHERKGAITDYFTVDRLFELSELKILIDIVQSSKFITEDIASALIRKIETLCSEHEAKRIKRQGIIVNRVRSMNSSVLYSIDAIQDAMNNDSIISFRYFDYNVKKTIVYRRKGRYYTSPYALISSDGYYYLLAYNHYRECFTHYRVDKMENVKMTGKERHGHEEFPKLDLGKYTKRIFSMYDGKDRKVTMHFATKLANVVIDRFGIDVTMTRIDDNWFKVTETVKISPPFLGWILGLGKDARIVAPEAVKKEMSEYLRGIMDSLANK